MRKKRRTLTRPDTLRTHAPMRTVDGEPSGKQHQPTPQSSLMIDGVRALIRRALRQLHLAKAASPYADNPLPYVEKASQLLRMALEVTDGNDD